MTDDCERAYEVLGMSAAPNTTQQSNSDLVFTEIERSAALRCLTLIAMMLLSMGTGTVMVVAMECGHLPIVMLLTYMAMELVQSLWACLLMSVVLKECSDLGSSRTQKRLDNWIKDWSKITSLNIGCAVFLIPWATLSEHFTSQHRIYIWVLDVSLSFTIMFAVYVHLYRRTLAPLVRKSRIVNSPINIRHVMQALVGLAHKPSVPAGATIPAQ